MVHESNSIYVNNSDEVVVNFATSFLVKPFVTATAYDSESNDEANVNVYIISITKHRLRLGFSATFTGTVHYQAIQSFP